MPPDIRSFFGGKGGQSAELGQEERPPANVSKDTKSRGRAKRKVLSDSEDDVEVRPLKKSTPPKPVHKRRIKQDSPIGEITSTSDYFASSGKSKPTRSSPTKARDPVQKETLQKPKASSPKSTPKSKDTPKAEPVTKGKVSTRSKHKPSYVEVHEDEDSDSDIKLLKDDANSGDDIFVVDYKTGRRDDADAYRNDDDEEEEILPPLRKTAKRGKGVSPRKPSVFSDNDKKTQREDIKKDGIAQHKESIASKTRNDIQPSKGRKRKSFELEDADDDDEDVLGTALNKGKSPKSKSASRKKPKKEDEPHVRTAVDEILDSIPTVRAPTPPPREEGKKFNFQTFAAKRNEPADSGSPAALPIGAENCLAGLTFVFTGILDTLERGVGQDLVKRHGGKITSGPSKKTSFVVLGNDAGPKKLETIEQYGLKTINENGLFELIRRLPANGGDGKAGEQYEAKQKAEEAKAEKAAEEMLKKEHSEAEKAASASIGYQPAKKGDIACAATVDSRLWTVKYAPTAISMIVGNKGQVEKLQAWLRAWPDNVRINFKKGNKDGWGVFRAMCLHGPPGIGKTTAAHLAAHLEGFDVLESNASDTRSKKLVETGLRGILDTTSLLGYFAGNGKKVEAQKKKLVLIMDEVDGMSAGDRGGVGALAAVCKKTSIPIILICNDRRQPKMKPFDQVAFDLPFRRPTTDQIRQRIMTICFREKLKIPPPVINALIEGTHADIRQVINMLSTAKLDQDAMDFDAGKQISKSWEKHVVLKPWDIVSKILGGGMFAPNSTSSLNDKIELYFNDHEFSSLMLQENYLGTNPILSNTLAGKDKNLKMLELVDKAAGSISDGDLVDRMIHGSQQQWALMPTHAVFSFVRPASFVSGSQAGNQTRFTSWLGNNSRTSK